MRLKKWLSVRCYHLVLELTLVSGAQKYRLGFQMAKIKRRSFIGIPSITKESKDQIENLAEVGILTCSCEKMINNNLIPSRHPQVRIQEINEIGKSTVVRGPMDQNEETRPRREILQGISSELADSICSYRGGYTIEDRRRIESGFFGGKLRGIVATDALELGIDVGHIDVTLHLGFPGRIASLWQQARRAGRRGKPSLAVYVSF